MKKIIFIIPTLNEEGNIYRLIKRIKKIISNCQILIIDDNSTDSTRKEIEAAFKKYQIKYILRSRRMGIGSAHKIGIKYAYKHKFKFALTLDADGTHDPKYIKKMLKVAKENCDLVITNRFLSKNSLSDWPLHRKILTHLRHYLINFLLQLKFDTSGAFRVYKLQNIKLKDILSAKHNGYSFFWESIFLLNKNKYTINEIKINLPARKLGSSKMKISDITDALCYLLKYSFKNFIINKF